jgi:hypothetical protein
MLVSPDFQMMFGKANLMASFNNWLMDTIQGGYLGTPPLPTDKRFFWAFNYPIAPQFTPAITVTERGLFNLGAMAFDQFLGYNENGNPMYGFRDQTLIEITCIDQDTDTYTRAANTVYNLRDRVISALATNTIPLINYYDPAKPVIGLIELDQGSNSINEKFMVDPGNQQVKRYVLLIRIFWQEILNTTNVKSLGSNAIIKVRQTKTINTNTVIS